MLSTFAHETAGATGTRHSPLPPQGSATPFVGRIIHAQPGRNASRECVCMLPSLRAKRAINSRSGCFAEPVIGRAMTARYTFVFPRRESPELCLNDPPNKGRGATPRGERGMPGARCTRSRACRVVSTRVSHHGRTGTPGIPARNGFNGLPRALPGDRALLSPSPRRYFCDT